MEEKGLLDYCDEACLEAQRWMEAVTKKKFGSNNFRSSLENGVLLCDLINNIKPGTIKRVNRLSTPIAGLDNINIFLKACAKLGFKEAQLFHPGDLQDLSTRVTVKHQETSRRVKNVLITIYWLGRKAQGDPSYNGPYLNLKAFEGLLGTTLYKALEGCTSPRGSVRKRDFRDSWYSEREEIFPLQARHRREDSSDSLDSLGSRTTSSSSETALKGSSEGFGSDPEAELGFRMSQNKDPISYRRSLAVTPKTTTPFNQFLPSKDKQTGYVPAPLRKKRAERHEDNRRSWTSPMYTEEDGTFSRNKSTSDVDVEQAVTMQVHYEQLEQVRAQVKENEDKWQDDLTKWKNRRRSVNTDLMKKKEEREQIEVLTSTSHTRKPKTFKEMSEEREREPGSFRSRFSTFSNSEDQDVFEEPAPRTRTMPSRSYTIDNPYTIGDRSSVRSLSTLSDDEPVEGSLASDEADSPLNSLDTSPGNQSKMSSSYKEYQGNITSSRSFQDNLISSSIQSNPTEPTTSSQPSSISSKPLEPKNSSNNKPVENTSSFVHPVPEPRHHYGRQEEDQSQASLYKPNSAETKQSGVARVSASLPRSYQRSDSARLTSVVTPRPFGTKTNKISSLPRAYTMDESHKRVNGDMDSTKKVAAPSHYAAFMKEDEVNSQTSSAHSSDEDEEEQEEEQVAPATQTSSVTPVSRVTPQPKAVSPINNTQQESYSDMRISLNQKPNSSRDFGFQSTWDSTGAHVKSIQPGSPAELCHLQVGDEILAVNGHKVADMSYEQWKSSMDKSQQQGSLLMDIRRHGKNSSPETYFNSSLNFTSQPAMDTSVKTLNVSSHSADNLAPHGINGGIPEEKVTLRNKGGAETGISDLPVPSLSTSTNRWSWDPEEERRRQEKWQKEQERLLQEKYRRDQEKMEAEFKKAQQEAQKEGTKQQEEEIRSLEHLEEQKHLEEERKRKEEQKRLEEEMKRKEQHKRLEEEKRRREEQERLEEEMNRREQQKRLEEEKKKEEEHLRKEEERRRREEEERRRQKAQERLQENDKDYTSIFPELSYSHRVKSKSTPELDEVDKTDVKAVSSGLSEKKEPLSQAELERQQIIQEMKKKTPLLTDRSWIRQQSTTSNINKDPVTLPMRRGESLDNLDTNRSSWRSSWAPGSTSSIPDYSRPHSALSGSSSYRSGHPGSATLPSSQSLSSIRQSWSTSSTPAQALHTKPEPQQSSQNRSVSGKKICTFCDLPLGKGAAMIIESLGLCYHLPCFKCIECKTDLGGSEAGAEVRIRNKQLYCNSCYLRVKAGQPTAM